MVNINHEHIKGRYPKATMVLLNSNFFNTIPYFYIKSDSNKMVCFYGNCIQCNIPHMAVVSLPLFPCLTSLIEEIEKSNVI